MSSITSGNLHDPKSPLWWILLSFAVQVLLVAGPGLIKAAQIESRVDVVEHRGSVALNDHEKKAAEVDGVQDSRLAAIEEAARLRGQQLDRIESDLKELLRRTPK